MLSLGTALQTALYTDDRRIGADLWTFYFESGAQRLTSHGANVTVDASTWNSMPGILERSGWRRSSDGSVDTMDLELKPEGLTIGGVGGMVAAQGGVFNGIRVLLQRLFWTVDTGAQAGLFVIEDGIVDEAKPGTDTLKLTIASAMTLLNEKVPRRVLSTRCPLLFGGTECGVTVGTANRTAAAGSTTKILNLSSSAAGITMVLGRVLFTTGALAGVSRVIRTVVTSTQVVLDMALPVAPTTGDAFTLRQGCARDRTACRSYSAIGRFQGAPDAPADDVMEGS